MTFRHYNTSKGKYSSPTKRFGLVFTMCPKVGINLDVFVGYHIWAFWFYPTKKYGKGTR